MHNRQWFLMLGLNADGERRVYKARLEDRIQAEQLAERLEFDDAATILDEAAVSRIGRYGYGFQLVFQIAPEISPADYGLGESETRQAA
ncbi:hypothetical protein KBTX_00072 [wastewater metagenome]|uniref:Uncharacterized protein n=2 Tax=unclassified sequences TaxID=12908 RepID=A0A5B8R913_9ZZZZ|nr:MULTISPECIES: hypothetical protein [Arhodomonas]MCS4502745.1 hypothetical protein [Arhodomonas aquaeolei]QEA03772.1 hypothetical protein KBTEX_00072 [uncultured organism]